MKTIKKYYCEGKKRTMNQIDIVRMKRRRLEVDIKNLEEKLEILKDQKRELEQTLLILQQVDPNEKKIIIHGETQ